MQCKLCFFMFKTFCRISEAMKFKLTGGHWVNLQEQPIFMGPTGLSAQKCASE